MTREIEKQSITYGEPEYLLQSPNVLGAQGFEQDAKWADKTMIEKACRWLEHQEEMIGISFEEDFIERFKKAMKE